MYPGGRQRSRKRLRRKQITGLRNAAMPIFRHTGQKKIRRIHHTSIPVLIVKLERRGYRYKDGFFCDKKGLRIDIRKRSCRVQASNEEDGI
jgi:hypothetical protein